MESISHQAEVVSQFTRQSRLFAEHRAHSENRSFEIFRELGRFSGNERVLDSGCGPGLVSCYLAPYVREIVGADLTPAMIKLASEKAANLGLQNTSFVHGNMTSLPFSNGEFAAAVTRYTFHHLQNPSEAFAELVRVTRPGGRIVVVDVTPEDAKRNAYDAFERKRDLSHTKALTVNELTTLGKFHGLQEPGVHRFGLSMSADSLIQSSFPENDGGDRLMELLAADVERDELSFSARREGNALFITFPLTAAVWSR